MRSTATTLELFAVSLIAIIAIAFTLNAAASNDLYPLWAAGTLVGTPDATQIYGDLTANMTSNSGLWATLAADNGLAKAHPFVQAPSVAYAIAPLAHRLGFEEFRKIFAVINSAALILTCALTAHTWLKNGLNRTYLVPATTLAVLAGYPAGYMLWQNQIQAIVILATITAILASTAKRTILAGTILALAIIVKITPVILAVFWLFTGRRKEGILAITLTASVAFATFAWGDAVLNDGYLLRLREIGSHIVPLQGNYSLLIWLPTDAAGHALSLVARAAVAVVSLALFCALVVMGKRVNPADRSRIDLVSVIAFIPLAPIAWEHYFVTTAIACVLMIDREKPWTWIIYVICLLSINIPHQSWPFPHGISVVVATYFVAVMIVYQTFYNARAHRTADGIIAPCR